MFFRGEIFFFTCFGQFREQFIYSSLHWKLSTEQSDPSSLVQNSVEKNDCFHSAVMKDDPSFAFNFYTVRASPVYFRNCIFQNWKAFCLFLQYKNVYDYGWLYRVQDPFRASFRCVIFSSNLPSNNIDEKNEAVG